MMIRPDPVSETAKPVLAANLSAHRTMINGALFARLRLSRSVTDPAGLTEPNRSERRMRLLNQHGAG